MKFVVGLMVGVALVWLYGSERARSAARQQLDAAPGVLAHVRQAAASSASSGAQRVSEMIDAAPVPAPVKSTASEAAFNAWAAADALAQVDVDEVGTRPQP